MLFSHSTRNDSNWQTQASVPASEHLLLWPKTKAASKSGACESLLWYGEAGARRWPPALASCGSLTDPNPKRSSMIALVSFGGAIIPKQKNTVNRALNKLLLLCGPYSAAKQRLFSKTRNRKVKRLRVKTLVLRFHQLKPFKKTTIRW